jgi:gamma-glutamyltranspeptidase/glutathione hydrolase
LQPSVSVFSFAVTINWPGNFVWLDSKYRGGFGVSQCSKANPRCRRQLASGWFRKNARHLGLVDRFDSAASLVFSNVYAQTKGSKLSRVAISADSQLTAAAGARVAELGGNAADVAVACSLAATVSEVLMCSLGGSAFFMVRMPGQPAELIDGADCRPNYRGPAPPEESQAWRRAHVAYGDGIDVMIGYASIAIPGMLAAAEKTWQRHGSLPWKEVVAPAAELASESVPVSRTLASWLALSGNHIFCHQDASREAFFQNGEVLQLGQSFQIRNLDRTFAAIAEEGAASFYRGELSKIIVDEIRRHGGLINAEDWASYEAAVRRPLLLNSGGFTMALNPPPAVGGAAVGYLVNATESVWSSRLSEADQVRLQADSQLSLLGIRKDKLLTEGFDESMATHLLHHSGLGGLGRGPLQSPNTTHLSVVTRDGGMVSVTQSMGYGAGIVIPELGIALNNSIGEPELNPRGFLQGEPGARILSNMAPTVSWHESDGRFLALGSPGASRITTAIAQTWLHVVLDGKSYEDAVAAPRIHIEECADEIRAQFEPGIDISQLGEPFTLRPFDAQNLYFGGVKLAGLDEKGRLHAVADARREGAVAFVD